MGTENFTLVDLTRVLLSGVFWPLVIIVPGYALAWVTDILHFRRSSLPIRIAIGMSLSMGVCPLLLYFYSSYLFPGHLEWALLPLWLLFLWQLLTSTGDLPSSPEADILHWKRNRSIVAILSLILLVTLAALVDLQIGDSLYLNLNTHDYVKHVAVTDAITRTGVPPINPFFHPGHPIELYYYYQWFMICSAVQQIIPFTIATRSVVLAGTLWTSLTFCATLLLLLRSWGPSILFDFRRQYYALAIGLLTVTGLDLIPVLAEGLDGTLPPTIEWWNEQVTGWLTAMIWVPHHVAAFSVALLVFLLASYSTGKTGRQRTLSSVLAAVCLTSCLGMSVWIAIVTAAILTLWVLWVSYIQEWEEIRWHLATGSLAIVASIPFLFDLYSANQAKRWPVALDVRDFLPLHRMLEGWKVDSWFLLEIADLFALPVNYSLELGVFLLGSLVYWNLRRKKRRSLNRNEQFLVLSVVTGLLIATFLRSTIAYNDLGWRAFMFVQLGLLIYCLPITYEVLFGKAELRIRLCRGFRILLLIGLLGTLYDLGSSRFLSFAPSAKMSFSLRQAHEWIDENLPRSVVIQEMPSNHVNLFLGLYGNRQTIVSDRLYGPLFGINPELYETYALQTVRLFVIDSSVRDIRNACRKLEIDFLVFSSGDPVWKTSSAWIWSAEAAFQNKHSRVIEIASLAD